MPVCLPALGADVIVDCILAGLRPFRPGFLRGHSFPQYASLHAGAALALQKAEDDGLWLEFGAASGASTRLLARYHHTHSFDSFFGLPERWRDVVNNRGIYNQRSLGKGAFDRAGRPPFPDGPGTNITWHVGLYNHTVHPFVRNYRQPVFLVHVDCDLYSSTKFVLGAIASRLAPGALLIFDELINYPEFM